MFNVDPDRVEQDNAFRYQGVRYSLGCDEYGDPYQGHRTAVVLYHYKIVKRTPKGFWISSPYGGNKFVLSSARKKFAHETAEDALESFIARKKRQIDILSRQLADANEELRLALNHTNDGGASLCSM